MGGGEGGLSEAKWRGRQVHGVVEIQWPLHASDLGPDENGEVLADGRKRAVKSSLFSLSEPMMFSHVTST